MRLSETTFGEFPIGAEVTYKGNVCVKIEEIRTIRGKVVNAEIIKRAFRETRTYLFIPPNYCQLEGASELKEITQLKFASER